MSKEKLEQAQSTWQEKLAHYEYELSITNDAGQKFELKKKIEECQVEIKRLETEIDSMARPEPKSVTTPPGVRLLTPAPSIETQETYRKAPIDLPLSKIPVTGDEASKVGADYTKLRDFLNNEEFGKADLETLRKILWVARREEHGWLDLEDIEDIPSQDLRTINQLWLVASKGKFGFSVQKQILGELGGLQNIYDESLFERFREKVEWNEKKAICFDQRAAKGHLPLGMYVILETNKKTKEWWAKQAKEREAIEKEIETMKEVIEELEKVKIKWMQQQPMKLNVRRVVRDVLWWMMELFYGDDWRTGCGSYLGGVVGIIVGKEKEKIVPYSFFLSCLDNNL